MNFLLEFSNEQFAQKNIPLSDIFSSGAMVVLTGMLTVFGVLCTLWLTLIGFKFFFYDLKQNRDKTKEIKDEPTPVQQANATSDNDELIAVIAAAIAMAESEFGGNKQFRVVSFKRK